MIRLFKVAWQAVSRQRLRSLLTAASLILGVMALTSVAAAQEVMRETITHTALLTGGPSITSAVAVLDPVDAGATASRWSRAVTARYGPGTATARVLTPSEFRLASDGTSKPDIELLLVDPTLIDVRPFDLVDGTWIGDANAGLSAQVVLNEAADAQYGQESHWTLRWGSAGEQTTATVIGIVDDAGASPTAYLDLSQNGIWRDAAVAKGSMALLVHAPHLTDTALRSALQQMQQLANVPGQTGDVRRTDTIEQLDAELNTTGRVFVAIAVVSLIIAAVGMLNIGLSTLAERSDELSLRRAFGAHRREIIALMLLEAQVVALTAGVIGVAASYALMPLTLTALGATSTAAAFPYAAAFAGVAAGSLAALVGAVTPAFKAMRTPIASIMRG